MLVLIATPPAPPPLPPRAPQIPPFLIVLPAEPTPRPQPRQTVH